MNSPPQSSSQIPIDQLIRIGDPTHYKLHVARFNHYEEPLDVFVASKEKWRGWNTWRNAKNEFNRQFIFSLIDFYPESDRWLFGGIYEVKERNPEVSAHSYIIQEVEQYSNLVGRLKIELKKPSRGRAFYLEKHYPGMFVAEILPEVYSGAGFPGFENIVIGLDQLKAIVLSQKSDWIAALSGIKGIYCLLDRRNGHKYIGSAYGDSGIWSRWSHYAASGHGGNRLLRQLIEKDGLEAVFHHFQIALLEHHPFNTDDRVIIARENHWKRLMLSRGDHGYNGN